jgi:hypothetical protein
LIATNNFLADAESAAKDNGVPVLRIVTVPASSYYKSRVSVEEMRPIAAGVLETAFKALTRPLTAEEAKPLPAKNKAMKTIKVTAATYTTVSEKLNDLFLTNRWSDGLPIVPPTKEAVKWMLKGTSRSPDEVLGKVSVKNGVATVEKIAINAVMAGAKPEYLPVIIAAMEALTDKDYDLKHVQASTGSVSPVIIVNGPIAKELNMNSGIGYLGHGWRANNTIGRAVRMCLINLGHVWPQVNDMGLTGREAAFGTYTFAENEEDSPWKPYQTDVGFKETDSTVTVTSVMWHLRQGPGGAVTVQTPREALESLLKIFADIGYPSSATRSWLWSKTYIVAMDPGLARSLAQLGYTKETVKQWLHQNARVSYAELSARARKELKEAVEDGRIPPSVLSKEQLREDGHIPVVKGPENIHIVVAGGMPGYTGVWGYPGPNFGHKTKAVKGATMTKAGR